MSQHICGLAALMATLAVFPASPRTFVAASTGTAPAVSSDQQAATQPAPLPPAGRFIPLELPSTDGVAPARGTVRVMFVPDEFRQGESRVDLLVHFHGDPPTVARNVAAADLKAVTVILNYPGLSAAYSKPMREDPDLFAKVLDTSLATLHREGLVAAEAQWGRVCVSSFSAGFGAVRELLKQDRYFERIDCLCMLDSIYAGYTGDPSERKVNAENMLGFRRFARAAADGEKTFILTHSYLVPGSYASTVETADDLLEHVGAVRRQVDERPAGTPLRVISRAGKGSFKVWGCAGTDGPAHMEHLRCMRVWLGECLGAKASD